MIGTVHRMASGRYRPSSDLVRSALRQALISGEQSGAPTAFDFDAFIARRHTGESQQQ